MKGLFLYFFVVGMKCSFATTITSTSIGGTAEDPLEANLEEDQDTSTTSSSTTLRTKRASFSRNRKIEQWLNVENKRTTW